MLVQDLLRRAQALYASRPALENRDAVASPAAPGEYRTPLTYGQLGTRVERLAAALQGLGLDFGEPVACLSWNTPRMMECFLAAPLAGLVLSPLNPRLAPAELAFILNDSGARVLLAQTALLPLLAPIRGELKHLRQMIVLDGGAQDSAAAERPAAASGLGGERLGGDVMGYEALLAGADPARLRERPWREDDLLLLCYTGGTTGRPKGVMLSQRNVLANALSTITMLELSGRDVWLHAAPMFHSADAWACYSLTALGARHVFLERFDAAAALALIERERVTATSIVPTMINAMLEVPGGARFDLSSLRRVLYGASSMPVERLKAAIARFGPILQQAYGQSESSPFLATTTLESTVLPRPEGGLSNEQVRRLASCGQPILGVEVRIVDPQGRDVPAGSVEDHIVGELIARGPSVMLGYWNRPEETAAALRDGWLHTGDLAWRDAEGFLYIVDRLKDLIISGGDNIYSSEVEQALYSHPAVLEAAVIGTPDPHWGESVKAVVVMRAGYSDPAGDSAMAETLIAHCRGLIARYKCPRTVEFRPSLPKTGAGKILKSELRKKAQPV